MKTMKIMGLNTTKELLNSINKKKYFIFFQKKG